MTEPTKETIHAADATIEQLESYVKLLELKVVAFNVVLEHAKDVVIDKVTLDGAAIRVHAHNFYANIQSVIAKELEQVKGLLAQRKEVATPMTTPEPTKTMSAAEFAYGVQNQQSYAGITAQTANEQSHLQGIAQEASNS